MSLTNLVNAMNVYRRTQEQLKPENWLTMDVFRSFLPDWLPSGMPEPGSSPADTGQRQKVLAALLAGEGVPDATLQKLFGFTNAQLQAQQRQADPVIAPIPDHLVLMTFDDSTLDHYTIAAPELEKYGGHGIFYTTQMLPGEGMPGMGPNPGFADKSRYMTWQQIRELSDRGHEIGNHSLHHDIDFSTASDEDICKSVLGLEEKCREYGIPKPVNIGYPGGSCTRHVMELLHTLGYLWGRGSQVKDSPVVEADAWYDPYVHIPLCIPNHMAMTRERIQAAVEGAVHGKIALFVYHEVTPGPMMQVPFAEQIRLIYDLGGRAVTTRELAEYIDAQKAWEYCCPVRPDRPQRGPLPGAPRPNA